MAAASMQLRVLTDAGVVLEDEAVSVIAPGERGYLGVLRNHAPLVTTLGRGHLIWRRPDGALQNMDVDSGLMEVLRNRVTVLTAVTATSEAPPSN